MISEAFLRDHKLKLETLTEDVQHYLENYYFLKNEKFYKARITKDNNL